MTYQHYIGLDVHKQFVFATKLDSAGQVVKQWRFATTSKALKSFAASLTKHDALCLESTTNAVAIYRLIRRQADRVVISNPLQTKAIASAKIKTDKVDSRVLAELLRAEYLPTVWVPDDYTIRLRGLTSYRTALIRQRSQLKNRIHAILHRNLVAKPEVSDLFGKQGKAFLEQVKLPADERFQMDQELLLLNVLNAQITDADKRIAQTTIDTPQMRLLLTIPGFSLQVAAGVLAAIGTISRFGEPDKLVSYLGLDPLGKRSADHAFGPTRISKRGRSHARWLLVEAAHATVRCPGPLQAFYLRLRKKKAHNKAVCAVARKLVVLIWQMLTKDQPYSWAPPLRTHEKIRHIQIMAGKPKQKAGSKSGQPSKGGRRAYLQRRQADHDMARLAQAQYEQLVALRAKSAKGT